jgi:DNA primase
MLNTLAITTNIKDIPNPWVFEYYLKLSERLLGQELKINSVFTADKTPSFTIFPTEDGKYCFKDFSSGKGGNHVTLVQEMFNISSLDAIKKIASDYTNSVSKGEISATHNLSEFKVRTNFKVQWVQPRKWTKEDEKFWSQFKIGSKLLEKFNIKPLSEYKLVRESPYKELTISGPNLYGYFRKEGACYKIYQPFAKEYKFIKISDYIQGYHQLTYDKPYLVIMASLKDMMSFYKLGFKNVEAIAPHSENTMIPKATMERLLSKYKGVCTMFDNDEAGIKGMTKYKETYKKI